MRQGEFRQLKEKLDVVGIINDMVDYIYSRPNMKLHDEINEAISYFNGEIEWDGGYFNESPKDMRDYIKSLSDDYVFNNTYIGPAIARQIGGASVHLSDGQKADLFGDVNYEKIFTNRVFKNWNIKNFSDENRLERRKEYLNNQIFKNGSIEKIESLLKLCGYKEISEYHWEKGKSSVIFDDIYMHLESGRFYYDDKSKKVIDYITLFKWIGDNELC